MKFVIALSLATAALMVGARDLVSPDGRLSVRINAKDLAVSYDGARVVTVRGFADAASAALRVTNAGVAWKVAHDTGAYTFDFAEDARCWPVSHAQGKYEPLPLSRLGDQKPIPGFAPVVSGKGKMHNYDARYVVPGSCESPLVVEPKNCVVALGDAAVYGGARWRFKRGATAGTVESYLEGPLPDDEPSWKYVRVAKTPWELYNGNAFVTDLCRPCTDAALAALGRKGPGKVLRVARLDTSVARDAVDFVKRHNMQYIELDSGWYGHEHTGDPLKPGLAPDRVARGDTFDLQAILDYAKSRDVGVILYVNRSPLQKNGEKILDQLKAWGVAGVKYGFLAVGSSEARRTAFRLVEAAAKRGLLVDIHDEMRLTGEQRTYPNLMTVEGICGNEEMPTADHNAALVFTRYLTGPGDYTPCWRHGRLKTTCAHQLAMAACYESPWTFLYWYAKPSDVKPSAALSFWDEIPTVFDETRALAGEIGEYAIVARRAGDAWFVGGLNGRDRRTMTFDTSFLGAGAWTCRLYRDADPSLEKGHGDVAVETVAVGGTFSVEAAARGGFAALFTRAK